MMAQGRNSSNLNEYYESLRNNVITLLEHVRIPNHSGGNNHNTIINSATSLERGATQEHFDSYLSKLQSLCTSDGYGASDENRPIYETVKSTLQDFTVLPTAI